MRRYAAWVVAFALGVSVGWWGRSAPTAVDPLRQSLRKGIARQEAVVQAARLEYERHPESWAAAHRLALVLLTLRDWQRTAGPELDLSQSPAPLEAELRHLADRSTALARTPTEQDLAARLHGRLGAERDY